jgi:putative regulatory protein susR
MRKLLLYIFLLALPTGLFADNDTQHLQEQLDLLLSHQTAHIKRKNETINRIKKGLLTEEKTLKRLQTYDLLYQEYYVFQFDSAMTYLDKGIDLAKETANTYYYNSNVIHKAELLSIGGLYSEAIETISLVDTTALDRTQKFDFYLSLFRIHTYWADFCNDHTYTPAHREKAKQALIKAMDYCDETAKTYEYYYGEYCVFVLNDPKKARSHYLKATSLLPTDSRFYAMACFALSGSYANEGRTDQQERFLLLSSIADAENCTMENYALQTLAMYIFEHDKNRIDRAQEYIQKSLEDARFYNNRLRIIEISNKLPVIVNSYQQTLNTRNRVQMIAIIAISLLLIFLLVAITYIVKQTKRLRLQQRELQKNNDRLSELNTRQKGLNTQLHKLNALLIDTNRKREGLAKLYIDLCAKYITRLKQQQTLVKRKIKANQTSELLSQLSSGRLSEEDASTFLSRFDKAFLDLYPTFTKELNALLKADCLIKNTHSNELTTDQRIMALIRLGVKESAEIADLLFYSPQTIYNYRSALKAKAINKTDFEAEVAKLCTIIEND